MDILNYQFKPGTVVRDKETGEIYKVDYFRQNFVHFVSIKKEDVVMYDYKYRLGTRYIKDKTYTVLYGHNGNI